MTLAPELSERISILRFPLIVGVVFLHAYDPVIGRSSELHYLGWSRFLFDYISEGLATLSVPLFFLLAGYLFFAGFQPSAAGFSRKIGKRIRTLLAPLLFWNLLCLAIVAAAEATPATAQFFSGRSAPIATFGAMDYLNALLGVTTHPIAYQFWFVRDLLVLVILSPLIYFLLKRAWFLVLLLLAVRWFPVSTAWAVPFPSREAALFFCMGSLAAIKEIDLRFPDKWAALSLAYLPLSLLDAFTKGLIANNPIHKTAELFGVALAFCATRWIWQSGGLKSLLMALSPASFFVFAAHEPLLTAVRKLSYVLWQPLDTAKTLLLYFADPLLVVAACTAVYFVCARTMPTLTSFVTGGRTGAPRPQTPAEVPSLPAVTPQAVM